MTEPATIAWIFYSLRLASSCAPADFREISKVADGLNQAVPTHKEMQNSLEWLAETGLVAKDARGYSPSAAGVELLAEVSAGTAYEVLRQLTEKIGGQLNRSPDISRE